LILAVMGLVVAASWIAWPAGWSTAFGLMQRAKWGALRSLGFEPDRSEIDAYWRDRRDRREVRTRERYKTICEGMAPEKQAFLRAAGMGPDQAVVRWGNYDMTLVMSGEVFASVNSGRVYQLRPCVRSLWMRQIQTFGMDLCVFQLPDTPEVRRLAGPAGAEVIPGFFQTTNSWGCRGPEPDGNAPVRGLVLGDSFMQGYLVGDEQTAPEQLRRFLRDELGKEVSILNTGTLGYCPEHYYYTLKEYIGRFRPRFVVVGLYSNDFGEDGDVLSGRADWREAEHWLNLIVRLCRSHGALCLFAPVPCEIQLIATRNQGHWPGGAANLTGASGRNFCDPTEAFIEEDLKFRPPWNARGIVRGGRSHLYNADLGDGHLSPAGTALWGKVVARRLAQLIAKEPEE
jgi:hypothetical protein